MAVKDPRWATDAVYTGGPDNTHPNKEEPTAGLRAQGVEPTDLFGAQLFNWLMHTHGDILHRYQTLEWAQLTKLPMGSVGTFTSPSGVRWLDTLGKYVAWSNGGDMYESLPPLTRWLQVAEIDAPNLFNDAISVGDYIVAAATDGVYYFTGVIWVLVSGGVSLRLEKSGTHTVVVGGGGVRVLTGTDPTAAWSIVALPVPGPGSRSWTEVAYGNGTWVAAGSLADGGNFDIMVATTADPTTAWTDRTTTAPAGIGGGVTDTVDALVFDGDAFYMLTRDVLNPLACAVYKSADGVSWTLVYNLAQMCTDLGADNPRGLRAHEGRLFLWWFNYIASSADGGASWDVIQFPTGDGPTDMSVDGPRIVAGTSDNVDKHLYAGPARSVWRTYT